MKLEDTLHLALRIFIHNRLRTSLTILAVGVGIGAIVFLVSLGYGLQNLAIERFASAAALRSIDVRSLPESGKPLEKAAVSLLKELPGVGRVEPIAQLPGRLESQQVVIDSLVSGGSDYFLESEGLKFATGKIFAGANEVVISSAIAKLLERAPAELVGTHYNLKITAETAKGDKEVDLGEVTITGVVADNLAATIYLPTTTLFPYAERGVQQVKLEVKDPKQTKEVRDKVMAMGFDATTTIEDVEGLERGFRLARIIMAVLGLVAVAVASIGLFNIMTISLLERTREVGIMKALGASDHDVWQIFLAESSLIGFLGGLMGLFLGVVGSRVVNTIYNVVALRVGAQAVPLFATPWFFVIGIVVFGLVVGVVTGVWPALRAARLNPLQALRYE